MLTAAHSYANDATWSWVPQLLDNKIKVASYFSVEQGLNYNTPEASISKGMAIAAAVTSDDIARAKSLIGSDLLFGGIKPLEQTPLEVRYSKSTDQVVFTSAKPDTINFVDPFTDKVRTVPLLAPAKRLKLSPDGKLAAVLYGGVVDLFDVITAKRIRASQLASERGDVLLFNSGEAYILGGDQWSGMPGFINAYTGTLTTPKIKYAAGTYWGISQTGVVADKINLLITTSNGLSPSKLTSLKYDPVAPSTVLDSRDWPYHGGYNASNPIALNSKQTLVFDSNLNVANTSDLTYAGKLNLSGSLLSLSSSSDDTELLAVSADYANYAGNANNDTLPKLYYQIDPTLFYQSHCKLPCHRWLANVWIGSVS